MTEKSRKPKQMQSNYYPYYRVPIIVTKGADISRYLPPNSPPGVPPPVIIQISLFKLLAGIASVILGLPDRTLPPFISGSAPHRPRTRSREAPLSGFPQRSKSNRLFYMYKPLFQTPAAVPKSIPKAQAQKVISKLRKGDIEGRLFAVWAKSADEARGMVRRGEAFPYEPSMGLAGDIMNCGVWQPTFSEKSGAEVWRCLKYAAACETAPPGACVPSGNTLKQCVKSKKVFSSFYEKEIARCAKYQAACNPRGCLPGQMPKPAIRLQRNIDREIRDVASDMAADANAKTPDLSREIMSRGGIKPRPHGVEKEEYSLIPLHLKRKKGMALDEIADEMGMREDDLYQLIRAEYPGGKRKKKRRFTWEDFRAEAEGAVRMSEESFGGAGDLFQLKREMVLDIDDPAKSDDPVMICMERRGWKPNRVLEIQSKISEKLTPDLFTGKPEKLTGSEIQMQEQIQECLDRLSQSQGKKGQLDLFGSRLRRAKR